MQADWELIKITPYRASVVERRIFLLHMYDQLFNDINRHLTVIWQSIGVVLGAFAVFSLVEKGILSLDIAAALVVLLSLWLVAHVQDASAWYNRNLVIIANIQREFLRPTDLKAIHYYFANHRKPGSMISCLRIQRVLGYSVLILVLAHHLFDRALLSGLAFLVRAFPSKANLWSYLPKFLSIGLNNAPDFTASMLLPYAVAVVGIAWVVASKGVDDNNYSEFVRKSPGRHIDVSDFDEDTEHS
jgi:hypothetical protein